MVAARVRLERRLKLEQRGAGGIDVALEPHMVGFERVEARGEARVEALEDGEVVKVLNLMMAVEIADQSEKPWRRHRGNLGGGSTARVVVGGESFERYAVAAKVIVDVQPEGGLRGPRRGPGFTWMAVEQHAQLARPPELAFGVVGQARDLGKGPRPGEAGGAGLVGRTGLAAGKSRGGAIFFRLRSPALPVTP